MIPWFFQLPTRILFGDESFRCLATETGRLGSRPLLVTDKHVERLMETQQIAAELKPVEIFAKVEPNPTVANVDDLAMRIRTSGADVLVAVGGGSVMDCAKAAACLARSEETSIRPFHRGVRKLGGLRLPVVAVPTTAGTGAEVTPFAVLDDREQGRKAPLAADALYPTLAVVDPLLTLGLPKAVTAATGLDALCHAIEGYWSRNHQPICDLFALEAARLIFANFETVIREPSNREARRAVSLAALLAGMAFQLPKNAMVHACSFPLSNHFHLPHGVACALTLEFAIRFNTPHMDGRMEVFARHCGFEQVDAMVSRVRTMKRLGGLPCTLADARIPHEAIPALINESFHPLMQNNPAPVTPVDLERLYAELRTNTAP